MGTGRGLQPQGDHTIAGFLSGKYQQQRRRTRGPSGQEPPEEINACHSPTWAGRHHCPPEDKEGPRGHSALTWNVGGGEELSRARLKIRVVRRPVAPHVNIR